MVHVKRILVNGGAALLVVVGLVGEPAAATGAEPSRSGAAHCVVELRPLGSTFVPSPVCFETQGDATGFARDAVGSSSARGALASTILGTAYKDANGGGSSFTFWGSSGCAGVVFGFSSLPSGWDNSISSAGGSNGCWATLYSTTGYGGSRLNCTAWCGSVYSLNDNVRSIVFRPTGTFG